MRVGLPWGIVAAAVVLTSGKSHGAETAYHGRKAWKVQNRRMQVLVTPGGGHIASMTLLSGRGAKLNPLWLPPWPSAEPGAWSRAGGLYGDRPGAQLLCCILGHNLCLDFFGEPSKAETAAGIPVHGEAPCIPWQASSVSDTSLTYHAMLPLARMHVTRTLNMAPGDPVVKITETVENLSAFDVPFGWQQHVTLGPPFLQQGASFFDMPATKSQVSPAEFSKGERLKRGATFDWPNAPGSKEAMVDLRDWPKPGVSSDFTTSIIDPARKWAYFTAVNTNKGLLIGYAWPRKDWPWVGNWEESRFRTGKPWLGKGLTRGMEFGTTPFPYSRRQAVTQAKLFNTPTYRWISAHGKQSITYYAFLTPIPPGAKGVKDIQVEANKITISLQGVDKTIRLTAAR